MFKLRVYQSSLRLEGAAIGGENPLPMFRNSQHHREVADNGTLTEEHRKKLGYETGERFLPYRMQDRYSRERTELLIETIILENDHLQAVFLPQYGGRLYALIDKKSNRDILYTNPVFQPANLAILNAWFSGGIEWNIGQLGHAFTTCSPVHAAILKDHKGDDFLRIYDYERTKNVFWHIDFHLPAGSDKLLIYVRIINDNNRPVPMYWWTNIAVEETAKARVFSATDEVIYIDHSIKGFGLGTLPHLPTVPDKDVSYPLNFPFSNEYFFQTPASNEYPWEAVAYEDGRMFYERSTSRLRYRKMFCWGNHAGGRRWCDFLANPGEGNYIEIQGGFAPTQLHGLDMPAHSEWDFTQAIGMTDIEAELAHQQDWNKAKTYIQQNVDRHIDKDEMLAIHRSLAAQAGTTPEQKLFHGSEWGELERLRREKLENRRIPAGFHFSKRQQAQGSPSQDWQALLNDGRFPERGIHEIPSAWMVQEEWLDLLVASLQSARNQSWNAYMHLGVMLYENGKEEDAIAVWETSIYLQPSVWVYRNLAEAMNRKGLTEQALNYWERASNIAQSFPDQALAEEYLNLLIRVERFAEAWRVYQSLPEAYASSDRIQIIVGAAALELDELAFVERLFLQEFAVIREGETLIIELWYKYNAKKLAKARNEPLNEALLAEAKLMFPPPANIDFRMIGE
jgi:tetratricopeptide (TPR) repeat protein